MRTLGIAEESGFTPWYPVGTYWPAPDYLCPWWPVRAVERYQGPFNKKLANKIIVASNVVSVLSLLVTWFSDP